MNKNVLKQVAEEKQMEKCKCGDPSIELHTCPFSEEINGDSESLCNCCQHCEHECAMDI